MTDADLLLGYLDPDYFLGGRLRLSVGLAELAVGELAEELGMSVVAAAWGIYQLVDENMAAAARMHAIERGLDYRGLPLLAFGGAGPVHACHVAELLDGEMVIFPLRASVLSAFGTLVTPPRLDLVRSAPGELASLDWSRINGLFAAMAAEGVDGLRRSGIAATEVRFVRQADLRYVGQHYEVTARLPDGALDAASLAAIQASFEAEYERLYGLRVAGVAIEAVTWRLTALGPTPHFPAHPGGSRRVAPEPPRKGERLVYFGAHQPTPIYDRASLQVGDQIVGPALVEEPDTTVVLRPGWTATVDELGSLVARRQPT